MHKGKPHDYRPRAYYRVSGARSFRMASLQLTHSEAAVWARWATYNSGAASSAKKHHSLPNSSVELRLCCMGGEEGKRRGGVKLAHAHSRRNNQRLSLNVCVMVYSMRIGVVTDLTGL